MNSKYLHFSAIFVVISTSMDIISTLVGLSLSFPETNPIANYMGLTTFLLCSYLVGLGIAIATTLINAKFPILCKQLIILNLVFGSVRMYAALSNIYIVSVVL